MAPEVQPPDAEMLELQRRLENLQLTKDCDTLERAANVAAKILRDLNVSIDPSDDDSFQWKESMQGLLTLPRPRVVVGVVGNTGAGKSSVINAVLDEGQLLPTNCVRACTASPTEISYNFSEDPNKLYRAEIEFISQDSWIQDLSISIGDLSDAPGGNQASDPTGDSDAAIALRKIQAVYPGIKKEEILSEGTELANRECIRSVFGITQEIYTQKDKELYKQIQKFVDSKEKCRGQPSKVQAIASDSKDNDPDPDAEHTAALENNSAADLEFEYWPLIKVVRIFTKAKVLELGTVLVDLPGVHDSNAARAAVAQNYMKECDYLWVISPITRAVDDKTAKCLLGDSFKMQLKLDGATSKVTFICSKTDDISVTEAVEVLGIDKEPIWQKSHDVMEELHSLNQTMRGLSSQMDALNQSVKDADEKIRSWRRRLNDLKKGRKTVFTPPQPTKKRKRANGGSGRRVKKSGHNYSDSVSTSGDEDKNASDSNQRTEEQAQEENEPLPLTRKDIEKKLKDFNIEKKEDLQKAKKLTGVKGDAESQRSQRQKESDNLEALITANCVKKRNDYSRQAIKLDYAMGIREADQEVMALENEDDFDPSQDFRDYDEVAANLPVFCVSSRAYQKLSGRIKKDNVSLDGFPSPEDTEIPQLQEHARNLTEDTRLSAYQDFLNNFQQVVQSVFMWASMSSRLQKLAEQTKKSRNQNLQGALAELRANISNSIDECESEIKATLEHEISVCLSRNIPMAAGDAPDVAKVWGTKGEPKSLAYSTWKAIGRRHGEYRSKSAGPQDWNMALTVPLTKYLIAPWENTFQTSVPATLQNFETAFISHIQKFHDDFTKHLTAWGRDYDQPRRMLRRQLATRYRYVKSTQVETAHMVQQLQRGVSRQFKTKIRTAMAEAYIFIKNGSGKGIWKLMKERLDEVVEEKKVKMYLETASHIDKLLDNDIRFPVRESLSQGMEQALKSIERDYKGSLLCESRPKTWKAEQKRKDKILELIRGFAKEFVEAFDGGVQVKDVTPIKTENTAIKEEQSD